MFNNKHVLEASKNLKGNAFRVWIYIMFSHDEWDMNVLCNDLDIGFTACNNAFETLKEKGYSRTVYKDGKYSHTEYHLMPIKEKQN